MSDQIKSAKTTSSLLATSCAKGGGAGGGPGRVPWVRPVALVQGVSPPAHLQAALDLLKQQTPPHPYADQVACALRRMGDVFGKPLERISTEPTSLRAMIAQALPATQRRMSAKRWARIRSLVTTYLRTTGVDIEPGRNVAGHSEAWRVLCSGVSKNDAVAISRFASFCTREGFEPADVTAQTFEAFAAAIRDRSLKENPDAILRNTITHWNRAASRSPNWPQITIEQARHARFYSLPWEAYPAGYQAEVKALLVRSRNASIFSKDYKRSVKESTVSLQRRQIRLLSALLVESGFPIEKLTSLAVLLQPENASAAFQRHIDRKAGKVTHSLVQAANYAARLARHSQSPSDAELLKIYAENLATRLQEQGGTSGMTYRNRQQLRQFDLPTNRKALLCLPDDVFAEARATKVGDRTQARRVMLAVAVELLLSCAFRGSNLVSLEIDRHFHDVRRGRTSVRYLTIPAAEMKGNEDFEMSLPERTAALLDEYLTVYRPLLAPEGSAYLFPGKTGRLRDKTHFATAITDFIRRETGLIMHLHLFRHFAVKLHFDNHPDDVETPRRFLQHKSSKTTLKHYAEVRSDRAFSSWHQTLAAERNGGGQPNAHGG